MSMVAVLIHEIGWAFPLGVFIKDPQDVKLPCMPGRVHIRAGEQMLIAEELVRRNICTWIPLNTVYKINGTLILNGLFGVAMAATASTGLPVLRLIMNLTGSNPSPWRRCEEK